MQHVQNCAARLVSKKKIASGGLDKVMNDFHWLKVKYRPIYKVLLIVHNCLLGKAPEEIQQMIHYGDSSRTMNLQETKFHNKYGCRAFSHVGPKLWNLLPRDIRDVVDTTKFKKSLKSFLMLRGEEFGTWALSAPIPNAWELLHLPCYPLLHTPQKIHQIDPIFLPNF